MADVRGMSIGIAAATAIAAALVAIAGQPGAPDEVQTVAMPTAPATEVVARPRTEPSALRRGVPATADPVAVATPPASSRLARSVDRDRSVRVFGQVCLRDGRPAAGARVALGALGGRCDADGRFELFTGETVTASDDLVAWLAGVEPAVWPHFGAQIAIADGPRSFGAIRLDLGLEARTVRGRVVDRAGRPQKGWGISIHTIADDSLATGHDAPACDPPRHRPSRSDARGEFRVDGVLPPMHYLVAEKDGRQKTVRFDPTLEECVEIVVD